MKNKQKTHIVSLVPRQERFCQAFVHYGQAAAAARAAGYAPKASNRQGWRLMRSDRIRARIREIEAELGRHEERAVATVIGKLEIVYRRALEDHKFHAAARAVDLQARLLAAADGERCTSSVHLRPGTPDPLPKYTWAEPCDPAPFRARRDGG